jgi:hypothetical protein
MTASALRDRPASPSRREDRGRLSEFASAKLRRRYAQKPTTESKARDQAIMGERNDDE